MLKKGNPAPETGGDGFPGGWMHGAVLSATPHGGGRAHLSGSRQVSSSPHTTVHARRNRGSPIARSRFRRGANTARCRSVPNRQAQHPAARVSQATHAQAMGAGDGFNNAGTMRAGRAGIRARPEPPSSTPTGRESRFAGTAIMGFSFASEGERPSLAGNIGFPVWDAAPRTAQRLGGAPDGTHTLKVRCP